MSTVYGNQLLSKLVTDLEYANKLAVRHQPKGIRPIGATAFGTLPVGLRRLYLVLSEARERFNSYKAKHQELIADMRKFYPDASYSAAAMHSLMQASALPEFNEALDRLGKIEIDVAEYRTYCMFVEAVYQCEVWKLFPETYKTVYKVDNEWTVYHNSKPTLTNFDGEWTPPDDVDDSDD